MFLYWDINYLELNHCGRYELPMFEMEKNVTKKE